MHKANVTCTTVCIHCVLVVVGKSHQTDDSILNSYILDLRVFPGNGGSHSL